MFNYEINESWTIFDVLMFNVFVGERTENYPPPDIDFVVKWKVFGWQHWNQIIPLSLKLQSLEQCGKDWLSHSQKLAFGGWK